MPSWYDRNRHRYPTDWTAIATRVKDTANWVCQGCGAPHGPVPHILTVDHVVDHDPSNVSTENLVALCQRCHLRRQGMRPLPLSKDEAVQRLRQRNERERSQLTIPLT